ncbi:MAG: choice-of-anchor D domain-containing protein [Chloroflexota bacterium]|nr:choice-of-anchor D domain-containing protein [Chloroflexota bacterium]
MNRRNYVNWLMRLLLSVHLVLGLELWLIPSSVVYAATIINVNSTANTIADDGQCTLREAITAADADAASGALPGECPAGSGGDTIVLQANTAYTLSAVDNTWYGPNGLPPVTTPITITGHGATIVRGGGEDFRFFYVSPSGDLMLTDLTLRDGRAQGGAGGAGANGSGGGGAGLGGAIFNRGDLVLRNCTLVGNEAVGGVGGWGSNTDNITGGGAGGGGGGGLGGDGGRGHNYYPLDPDNGGAGGGGMGGDGGDAGDGGGGGGGYSGTGGLGGYNVAGGSGSPTGGGGGGGDNGYAGGAGSTGGGDGGNGSGSKNGTDGSDYGGGGGGAAGRSFSYSGGSGGDGGLGGGGGGGGNCYVSIFSEQGGAGGAGGIGGGGGGGGNCNDRGGAGGEGNWGGGGGGGGGSFNGIGGNGGNGGFGGGGGGGGDGNPTVGTGGAGGFGAGNGSNSLGHQIGGSGGGGAGLGGAIFNYQGTIMVTNSTLSGNAAHGGDGGDNGGPGDGGSGQAADGGSGYGGAIFNELGHVTILASTIASNTVAAGVGGTGYDGSYDGNPGSSGGGGIYNHAASANLTLKNTILANSVGGDDCENNGGAVTAPAGDRNLIESHASCGTPAVTDDPQLDPLADNDGPAFTHAIHSGSPAQDVGLCLVEASTDQCGTPRPQGNDCDIGAYELPYPVLALSKSAAPQNDVAYHGAVTCTLVLSNTGAGDSGDTLLTDTLPVSTTFAYWVAQPADATESGDQITWNGTVTASTSITFSFVVSHTGDYGEVITNTARYTHTSGNGSSQAVFYVVGPPQVGLTPPSLDFGSQVIGESSPSQTVTLENTGAASLEINNIAISASFTQTHACPVSLLPGTNCAIGVTFTPMTTGTHTGLLTVTTNALDSPHTVSLAGVGRSYGLFIHKAAVPNTDVAYHAPVTYSITLGNDGGVDATDVYLTDTLPVSVTFARFVEPVANLAHDSGGITWSGTVTAGQALTFTFVVTHVGGYGEEVVNTAVYSHASSSDLAQATFHVLGPPQVSLTPGTLDFGAQVVGTVGPTQTVTLTNTGASPLTLAGIVNSANFAHTHTCPASLDAGAGCVIDVVFAPVEAGVHTGSLTVTTNAASSPDRVDLTGMGVVSVTISKSVTPAVDVAYHGAVTYTVVLRNGGGTDADDSLLTDTLPLNVTFARFVHEINNLSYAGGQITWNGTLTAGQRITITFVTTHTGDYGDEVTNTARYYHATRQASAQATFHVLGSSQVELEPATLDFGTQMVNTVSPAQLITLTNEGQASLAIAHIASSASFTHTHDCPADLDGGEQCAISVRFGPTVIGPHTGGLTVTTDAASSPDVVSLSGVGVAPELSIGKVVLPDADVAYHGVVTYAIQLDNHGPVNASNTRLTDTLPVSVTFTRWVVRPPGAATSDGQVTWSGTVLVGEPVIVVFEATHVGGYGDVVTNTVEYDHVSGGGSAQAAFRVLGPPPAPDLEIIKTATPVVALPGQVITYVLAFSNTGQYTATGIVITDVMPVEHGGGVSCTWSIAELEPGARGTLTVTQVVTLGLPAGWVMTNTATIAGQTTEVITTNNTAWTTVIVANAPPVILEGAAISVTMSEDGYPIPFDLTLHAADDNGDLVTWHVGDAADHGTATVSGAGTSQIIAYTPTVNYNGSDSFVVHVADIHSETVATAVSLTILPVNDAPVLAFIGNQSIQEGAQLTFTITAEDPDGSLPALSAAYLPSGARFITSTGLFSWTPGCETSGVYTTTFTASDGALSDNETITITVIEACLTLQTLYLPFAARAYASPQPHPLMGPFPATPNQPASARGVVFYTSTLSLTGTLPANGCSYFSGAPDQIVPFVVDDQLALVRGGQDIFSYTFSSEGAHPTAAVVPVPLQIVAEIAAGDVVLEYRDVYDVLIYADEMWLIWTPSVSGSQCDVSRAGHKVNNWVGL